MTHMNRRHFGAGIVALGASLVMPVSTASAANVRIPTAPMRLSRLIERQLFDGKRISVARNWIIRFADSGRGIRVDGFQQQVSVDAPEKLERLAQIERSRSTDGRFPILLNSAGQIVGGGSEFAPADLDTALREAESIVAASGRSAATKRQAMRDLAAIQAAGSNVISQMPVDLFFPVGGDQRDSRELALPDGSKGAFELVYSSRSAVDRPWLDHSSRQITTRIGDSERVSREVWQMEEA